MTTFGGPMLERMEVWAEEVGPDARIEGAPEPADAELVADPGAAP